MIMDNKKQRKGGESDSIRRDSRLDEDPSARTIAFLRARLLSERSITKAANQKAQQLAQKVLDLERQLETVIKQRKRAEKATREALALLEQGAAADSEEDSVVPQHKEDENSIEKSQGGEEIDEYSSSTTAVEDSVEQKKSFHRKLSWQTRRGSIHSSDEETSSNAGSGKQFGNISRQRVKVSGSASKRHIGKSCRQIKKRELRTSTTEESEVTKQIEDVTLKEISVNPGANESTESIEKVVKIASNKESKSEKDTHADPFLHGAQKSNALQEQAMQQEDSKADKCRDVVVSQSMEDERKHEESEGDVEIEIEEALERRAELIDQYQGEENAQREWEARFKNQDFLPDEKTELMQAERRDPLNEYGNVAADKTLKEVTENIKQSVSNESKDRQSQMPATYQNDKGGSKTLKEHSADITDVSNGGSTDLKSKESQQKGEAQTCMRHRIISSNICVIENQPTNCDNRLGETADSVHNTCHETRRSEDAGALIERGLSTGDILHGHLQDKFVNSKCKFENLNVDLPANHMITNFGPLSVCSKPTNQSTEVQLGTVGMDTSYPRNIALCRADKSYMVPQATREKSLRSVTNSSPGQSIGYSKNGHQIFTNDKNFQISRQIRNNASDYMYSHSFNVGKKIASSPCKMQSQEELKNPNLCFPSPSDRFIQCNPKNLQLDNHGHKNCNNQAHRCQKPTMVEGASNLYPSEQSLVSQTMNTHAEGQYLSQRKANAMPPVSPQLSSSSEHYGSLCDDVLKSLQVAKKQLRQVLDQSSESSLQFPGIQNNNSAADVPKADNIDEFAIAPIGCNELFRLPLGAD